MGNQASRALTSTSGVRAYTDGQREALLHAVLDSIRETLLLVTAEGTVLFTNRPLPDGLEELAVGGSVVDCFPSESGEVARETIARVAETGELAQFQTRLRDPDGRTVHQVTRVLPLGRGGAGTAYCLLLSEVSGDARAEVPRRETDEMLRLVAQAADMGTWHWDLARDHITWDVVACRHLGVDRGPETPEAYLALVHPDDRTRVGAITKAVRGSGCFGHVEHRIQLPDGASRWLSLKGMVVASPEGTAERVLGGVFDVTDRHQLEEQLLQAQKMEAIGQLTAGVAHNFNNLLTVITPNLELALDAAPAQLRPELRDASEAAQRAAELVRQLMSLAGRRGEAVEVERFGAGEIVEHVVAICQSTFDSRIQVSIEAAEDLPELEVQRSEIEQALLNICLNARDALLDSGRVEPRLRIRVTRMASANAELVGRVKIRIEDNGAGMDEATRRRCFEPFFTTKDVGRGTGLGLAASYGIIAEHGGVVSCESAVGTGTVFVVSLPAAPADVPRLRPCALDDGPQAAREVIFVVDDDELVRRTVDRMLTRAGFVVISAASGREALRIVESGAPFDLCLLDLSMPDLHGLVLLDRIRSIRPDVRAVCMTGHPAESVPRDGFCGVVGKPVRYATLVRSLRTALDGRPLRTGAQLPAPGR